MATVLSVSGSPSATSRTVRLLRHLDTRRALQGHQVLPLDVRTVPAEALLGADFRHPAIVAAAELFARADGVVIGTPVHKASYSGVLKALLDLLPQYALTGKTALPLATIGTTAHVLAIDYALRPVLSSMGAAHVARAGSRSTRTSPSRRTAGSPSRRTRPRHSITPSTSSRPRSAGPPCQRRPADDSREPPAAVASRSSCCPAVPCPERRLSTPRPVRPGPGSRSPCRGSRGGAVPPSHAAVREVRRHRGPAG